MSENSTKMDHRSYFDRVQILPTKADHPLPQKELAEYLESVNFPQELIGIDVNGTLITESDPNATEIDPEALDLLKLTVVDKRNEGKAVILVSDSPGPQLLMLGQTLGMDDGTIGENGNIILWKSNLIIVNPLLGRDGLRSQISTVASSQDLQQDTDRIAPEFGGKPLDPRSKRWAFGANRVASISVFGPPGLISALEEQLVLPANTSADCSPNDHFFGIHPGIDFKRNKSRTLAMIAGTGRKVTMIGNAPSDWTDPSTGVRSTFVEGSRMNDEMKAGSAYISPFPLAQGVADILRTQS